MTPLEQKFQGGGGGGLIGRTIHGGGGEEGEVWIFSGITQFVFAESLKFV